MTETITGPPTNIISNNFSSNLEYLEQNIGRYIPAHALNDHIQHLFEPIDETQPEINGFDIEFNYIENRTAQEQFFCDYSSATLPHNKIKNRYSNVLPPERTRVQLKPEHDEEGSDYINANYIAGLIAGSERAYIATQGPLQTTFGDFWRMIWELNTVVIIMLTRELENGRLKCDRYWPDLDCPMIAGYFKIGLVEYKETPELTTRILELTNFESNEKRKVTQFQYTAWPDHGLPVSTTAFLDLAHSADDANFTNGPMVVHCSAGIGRSGTFCTVHSTIEKFKLDLEKHPDEEPHFNLVNTVLYMRDQRPGMVQTKDQYMFCYLAIKEETDRLFSEHKIKVVGQQDSQPLLPLSLSQEKSTIQTKQ